MTEPRWRKSSRSNVESDCVEVAHTMDAMRDSKNPTGPVLRVPSLAPLTQAIKTGQFDQ